MTVISRKFSACPVRTAAQTWDVIVATIAASNSDARKELQKISGIAASIISDETPGADPITVIGQGPRLRIYCLFDEDGSIEDANESALNWDPFIDDWEIHLPAEKEELEWIKKSFSDKGKRFKVYEAGTKITENTVSDETSKTKSLSINIEKLKNNG